MLLKYFPTVQCGVFVRRNDTALLLCDARQIPLPRISQPVNWYKTDRNLDNLKINFMAT
ncbi:hypothetical protein OBV_44060 [Oscillibacter valericigenes Sjm18-20]|nr:hypothetical protein OBV_44060 [Oscillibacter valericigenes Sjm18-20]